MANSNGKRPFDFLDDENSDKPKEKKVRFPKGKKVKPGNVAPAVVAEDFPSAPLDPRQAAKERAERRTEMTSKLFREENRGIHNNISAAEEDNYEDNEVFVDDGTKFEPFNLNQEREEGYFDEAGNFVEFLEEDKVKDAWLDSVEVDPRYAEKVSSVMKAEEEAEDVRDLSSEEIGKMKRRITDLLEPGETVLLALRRLKGTSNRKEKMSAENKAMFDQLTEDAVKLMDNGDYNVYHEKKEVFQREAEGYERLARARGYVTNLSAEGGDSALPGPVDASLAAKVTSNAGSEAFDMFAEDEDNLAPGLDSSATNQSSLDTSSSDENLQNDYVFDESSGYYYSSSLGYYYDPSSGLYCCASSGQWYSYNAETGAYDEILETVSSAS